MISRKRLKRKLKKYYYLLLCIALNPKSGYIDPYIGSPFKYWLTKRVPGHKRSAVFLRIYGDVANTGFRGWLTRKARVSGLKCSTAGKGGSIQAVIIGSGEDIEGVIREAWKGPARARVVKIEYHWFNKPVKKISKTKSAAGVTVDQDPWSQDVADRLRQTIEYLSVIMKHPNHYNETGRFSNAGEINRAATNRNLFVTHQSNINYVASSRNHVGFQNSLSSMITSVIRSISDHKHLTKLYFDARSLPVPKGNIFTDLAEAREYLRASNFPMVVKPATGSYGKGITVDVRTEAALTTAWDYARRYDEQIILEELIPGVDIRVIVVGGTARAALLRVPANVVGDGKNTIEKLIDRKNKERFMNPRLCKAPIVSDAYTEIFLARQGHSLKTVPKNGEVVFLHLKANLEAGGDSIGVMDYIHPDLKSLAEEAAKAFGVDVYWGIDLLVERIDLPRDKQRCAIIEVNSRANIFNVQFPMYGQPADAAQALIDHLFPGDLDDGDYPLESIEAEVTGILDPDFLEQACEQAHERMISGRIRLAADGGSARIWASGRRHHLLSFLDSLWSWPNKDRIVDRLFVSRHSKGAVNEAGFVIGDPYVCTDNCSPLKEELSSNTKFADDRQTTQYPEADLPAAPQDLNMLLYLQELERHGYRAEQLYEDLISFKKESSRGITGVYHSSIFCDTIFEKITPAQRILAFHGLPFRRGVRFKGNKLEQAIDYFSRLSHSCKLTSLHPVEISERYITNSKELKSAWRKERKKGTNNFVLAERPPGRNVCVAVVSHQAEGAMLVEPVSVIGDGVSTLAHLIDAKNRKRARNPWYRGKPVEIDRGLLKRLAKADLQPEDILSDGEKLCLESEACLEIGGETISAADYLHDDFYKKAVEAVKAIPGLNFAFVYLIIPSPDQPAGEQGWVISKIDTRPPAAMFHFPWKGRPIDLVGKVVACLCLGEQASWIETRDEVE